MKRKMAVGAPLVEPYFTKIKEQFDVVPFSQLVTPGHWLGEAETREICRGCEVVILEAEPVTRETLLDWKEHGLQLLICTRGNPANVDTAACRELGIPLTFTPGRNAQSVAEYTIALMLMLSKHLQRSVKALWDGSLTEAPVEDILQVPDVKDVAWMNDRVNAYSTIPLGSELYGKTLSLIGFGAIGRRVAKIALAFDMRVLAYDPYCTPEQVAAVGAEYADLEQALSEADFVSVHLPVNPSTVGMVNGDWFARMKDSVKFINTARAIVVDQAAMIDALQSGKVAGAAVDVMWQEPCPANHPFLQMEQVIVSPHQAGATVDIDTWQSRMVWEDLTCWMEGKPLAHPWFR